MAAAAMQEQHGSTSLTGSWVLDLSRSEPMAAYLHVLDAPANTIHTQAELEQMVPSRNAIILTESALTIYKRTGLNHYVETVQLGVERVIHDPGSEITKRAIASLISNGELSGYVYECNSVFPGGGDVFLVDARQLADGGLAHIQTLIARNNATGEQATIRRTWERVHFTQNDFQRLHGLSGLIAEE